MPPEERDELFAQVQRGALNVSDLRMIRRAQARRREQPERQDEADGDGRSVPPPALARLDWVEPPSGNGHGPATDVAAVRSRRGPTPAPPGSSSPAGRVPERRPASGATGEGPGATPAPRADPAAVAVAASASPATAAGGIVFDRTLIARTTGHDYAVEAVKQLEANADHLRRKLAKADFSGFDAALKRRLARAKADLRQVLAELP